MASVFLRLPADPLSKVGEYSSSALVVAISHADGAASRSAVRLGVDVTERSFCGFGLTVREAERRPVR